MVLGLTFAAVIALVTGVGAVADGLVVDHTAYPSVLALVVWPTASCYCDALWAVQRHQWTINAHCRDPATEGRVFPHWGRGEAQGRGVEIWCHPTHVCMTEYCHVSSLTLHFRPSLKSPIHFQRGVLPVPLDTHCVPSSVTHCHTGLQLGWLSTEDGEAQAKVAVEKQQLQEVTEALIIQVKQQALLAVSPQAETQHTLAAGIPHWKPPPLAGYTPKLQDLPLSVAPYTAQAQPQEEQRGCRPNANRHHTHTHTRSHTHTHTGGDRG